MACLRKYFILIGMGTYGTNRTILLLLLLYFINYRIYICITMIVCLSNRFISLFINEKVILRLLNLYETLEYYNIHNSYNYSLGSSEFTWLTITYVRKYHWKRGRDKHFS